MPHERLLTIPQRIKDSFEFLFLARHALGDGSPDSVDGTHATYHRELLDTLRDIGLSVEPANSFEALLSNPRKDFVISFLNRAGFHNSEMLAPLLCLYHDIPFLGGSAIVRGVSDDKHIMKRIARAIGVRTPDWRYMQRGGLCSDENNYFAADAYIVKPNASSASWGIRVTGSWQEAMEHVQHLHSTCHDAIVESRIEGYDLAVPVIGAITPWYLPVIRYEFDGGFRNYEQKRDLVDSKEGHSVLEPSTVTNEVEYMSGLLLQELWPFDHGRFEFRVDARTGDIYFIEVNLNCNLSSWKTIARASRHIGLEHCELIETIVCHSLSRQSLLNIELQPGRAA